MFVVSLSFGFEVGLLQKLGLGFSVDCISDGRSGSANQESAGASVFSFMVALPPFVRPGPDINHPARMESEHGLSGPPFGQICAALLAVAAVPTSSALAMQHLALDAILNSGPQLTTKRVDSVMNMCVSLRPSLH